MDRSDLPVRTMVGIEFQMFLGIETGNELDLAIQAFQLGHYPYLLLWTHEVNSK